ncbi:hypothetical protein RJ639_046596 [Escallonia herrerae]|uniref:LysM domain-containing protein n=1 Tax=Escallonia herrerae TaxID=1293975 RepID=A0AA89AZ33_9ASTE|nr:hypothetical protein RJ639_046596 [Escallonia herrerae]
MKMGIQATWLLLLTLGFLSAITPTAAQSFKCSSPTPCTSIVDYVSPNATTISAIKTLFGIKNLRSLLGANNLPLSTPATQPVAAKQKIKITFPCFCTNGTGISNKRPLYKVVPDDTLYHIAAEVFSGLVTYPQIQAVNNISDANNIEIGQELWIPLPCSCDEVDGEKVVHYGHVVDAGSTVEGIAQQYNTTEDTLLKLNGLASPNDLKAAAVLDVPLKACTSIVSTSSMDYPLLVPNGTYIFTANNCVRCNCDAANNMVLHCEPSHINSSSWQSCPSMQCQGADNLYLGNSTVSTCNRTTCGYAGYLNNQTILANAVVESTCSVRESSATKFSTQAWRWNFLLIFVQLVLFSLHLSL